jgi:hypothetical protein
MANKKTVKFYIYDYWTDKKLRKATQKEFEFFEEWRLRFFNESVTNIPGRHFGYPRTTVYVTREVEQ